MSRGEIRDGVLIRSKDWKEKEEKEVSDFLAVEKDIYLQYFPHNKAMFDDDDDGDGELPKENNAGGKEKKTVEKSDESSIEMIGSGSDSDDIDEESSGDNSENKSRSENESNSSENNE